MEYGESCLGITVVDIINAIILSTIHQQQVLRSTSRFVKPIIVSMLCR